MLKQVFQNLIPILALICAQSAPSMEIAEDYFHLTFPVGWEVKKKNQFFTLLVNRFPTASFKQNATVVVDRSKDAVAGFRKNPVEYFRGVQAATFGSSTIRSSENRKYDGFEGVYIVSLVGPAGFVQFSFVTQGVLYSIQFTSVDQKHLSEVEVLATSVFKTLKRN